MGSRFVGLAKIRKIKTFDNRANCPPELFQIGGHECSGGVLSRLIPTAHPTIKYTILNTVGNTAKVEILYLTARDNATPTAFGLS